VAWSFNGPLLGFLNGSLQILPLFMMTKTDLILLNLYCITLRLGQILEPRTVTTLLPRVSSPKNTLQDWDRYRAMPYPEKR